MSLNDAAKAAAVKKVTLLDESFARFAVWFGDIVPHVS